MNRMDILYYLQWIPPDDGVTGRRNMSENNSGLKSAFFVILLIHYQTARYISTVILLSSHFPLLLNQFKRVPSLNVSC
jgi:hypothetical protein